MLRRNDASFRDPDGFVFEWNGTIYRALTEGAATQFREQSVFYTAAMERGYLLPFDLVPSPADGHMAVRPARVPLITYPYEWGFDQLRDAALLTLDINLLALEHGLTLKDASAFNVQSVNGAPVFIDHTSFEATDGKLPWRPYSQFCRHFLNPLVVGSSLDMHVGAFFRMHMDGMPQQLANDLLPLRSKLSPSVFMHVVLHNRFVQRSATSEGHTEAKQITARGKQSDLLKQLRSFIDGLRPAKATSTWADYYDNTNYQDKAFDQKKAIVSGCFKNSSYKVVWDVGANDGTFSRLISGCVSTVLSLDLDHNAVNENYLKNKSLAGNISSLVYDVGNPSPPLGFRNRERKSLEERSTPDCALALAVIHHLAISANIPFELSASYFADLAPNLVIEFVGRQDSQVQRLLAQKNTSYDWYTEESFLAAYSSAFDIVERVEIEGTARVIFQMRSKGAS